MKLRFLGMVVGMLTAWAAQADTTWVDAGQVSGVWTAANSPYVIHAGNDTVATGDTLQIGAGVHVVFTGPYKFVVNGLLRAIGTPADSVVFTTDTVANSDRWRGLRFVHAHDSCRLEYCVIENGRAVGAGDDRFGGGIECFDSSPAIMHSTVRRNFALIDGGGIYCRENAAPTLTACDVHGNRVLVGGGGGMLTRNSAPRLIDCTIHDNVSLTDGGGLMFLTASLPVLHDCIIRGNHATAGGGGIYCGGVNTHATLTGCVIEENTAAAGGGIRVDPAQAVLTGCTLRDNEAEATGGGAHVRGNVTFTNSEFTGNLSASGGGLFADSLSIQLHHCLLLQNTATATGGAVHCRTSSLQIRRATMVANAAPQGAAVYIRDAAPTVNSSIVTGSATPAVFFRGATLASVRYSDFADNSGGDFGFHNDDHLQGPGSIGHVDRRNVNGDSCDVDLNIYLDPQFVNAPGGDFHLQASSPCIDGGDPVLPDDPDGTIPDMGRHYVHRPVTPPQPFDLLQPADGDTIHPGETTFCWQRSRDADTGDRVTYRVRFAAADTSYTRAAGFDTCLTLTTESLPLGAPGWVQWWVEARSLRPDSTIFSISTRQFFWEPPLVSVSVPETGVPHEFALYGNYPNPFNASTVIRFALPSAGNAILEVHDVLGRKVATLADGVHQAGEHAVTFDAAALGSGVYMTRLMAGERVAVKKMVMIK